jgi:hypothetical protein
LLGLEASDDLPGIHSQFDDLNRDLSTQAFISESKENKGLINKTKPPKADQRFGGYNLFLSQSQEDYD